MLDSVGEVAGRDCGGRGLDRAQRTEADADDPQCERCQRREDCGGDYQLDEEQPVKRAAHAGKRARENEHITRVLVFDRGAHAIAAATAGGGDREIRGTVAVGLAPRPDVNRLGQLRRRQLRALERVPAAQDPAADGAQLVVVDTLLRNRLTRASWAAPDRALDRRVRGLELLIRPRDKKRAQ